MCKELTVCSEHPVEQQNDAEPKLQVASSLQQVAAQLKSRHGTKTCAHFKKDDRWMETRVSMTCEFTFCS